MKLTAAQRRMLSTPPRDSRGHRNSGTMANAGWTDRTAVALERKGLIVWKLWPHFGGRWVVTDAGRALLTSKEARDGQT